MQALDGKVPGKGGCGLAAFLDSRYSKQAMVVGGRISELYQVISGILEGTVLGPILVLLHIADIAWAV